MPAGGRGPPLPQRRPQSRQSPCCLGAAAELGSGGGLSPLGALVPTDRTWAEKRAHGHKGRAGTGRPQGHAEHQQPLSTARSGLMISRPQTALRPGMGVQGGPTRARPERSPACLIWLRAHRSTSLALQVRWDKAAQTEGLRALLPPQLPSFGELQAPTGLGTGSGCLGAGGWDCLAPLSWTQPDAG